MKVLLLEDSNFQRKILVKKLMNLDISIRECSEATSALIYLEAENFDLVLTDLNLPDMSGVEFIKKLKKFKSDLPVIAITSPGSSIEHPEQAVAAGAAFYLNKPIEDLTPIKDFIKTLAK
jgi:two-component system chemotaxis response regulator CheY